MVSLQASLGYMNRVSPFPPAGLQSLFVLALLCLGLLFQVTMPGEPVDVACGVDHMVTLAKSFI